MGDGSFKKKRAPKGSKTIVYDGFEDARNNCFKQKQKLMNTNKKKDVSQAETEQEKEKYRMLRNILKKKTQKPKRRKKIATS
ncbi:hypothetical protein Zmor_024031 [Zophobas morio]|uniref:Uncharacterized protein n=1 Tax=Zophobas morio TaxID=2755281 RepID=A0AA38HZL9_9CUCU|nr:hypothetical protein Zmor_024031 [Zophobas morio]